MDNRRVRVKRDDMQQNSKVEMKRNIDIWYISGLPQASATAETRRDIDENTLKNLLCFQKGFCSEEDDLHFKKALM